MSNFPPFWNAYYAAPELLQTERSSSSSSCCGSSSSSGDVYALGLIMWQLFAGRDYSPQGDRTAHVLRVVNDDWRPAFPLHMPTKLKNLIARCWQRSPEARPTCREIQQELRECQLTE
jgi:serine/threonine protein kinase